MKLTCAQMEILLSFYLENEISPALKQEVEEHLNECESCFEKYKMIYDLFSDMKCGVNDDFEDSAFTNVHGNDFSTKISAYIDNELTNDESIKIKKLAITNKAVRRELEDSYNIRRLMSDSFKKSKAEAKDDYTKSILKQLELHDEISANFHPAVRLLAVFALVVLVLSAILFVSMSV